MNSSLDEQMQRVYAPLDADHDRSREQLMALLPEEVPAVPSARRPHRRHWTGWLIMKRRILPLTIAAAAAVTLVVGIWPGQQQGGLAWADVIRQLKEARTAHLRMTIQDPESYGGKVVTQDMYVKIPGMLRCEGLDPQTGKQKVVIVNGDRTVVLLPEEKRHDAMANTFVPAGWLDDMVKLLDMSQAPSRPAQSRPTEGPASWRWSPLGPEERDGRKLHKYRIEIPTEEASTSSAGAAFIWVDPAKNQVVLLTYERTVNGKRLEVQRNEVELNPDLPDELFSTAVPAGYRSDAAASMAVSEVVRKYEQAAKGLTRYRLILWGSKPSERGARNGSKMFWEEVASSGVQPDAPFEEVWRRVTRRDVAVSEHVPNGRVTRVLWSDAKVHSVYDQGKFDPEDDKIAELGWPHFAGSMVWATFTKKATFRLLPPDPKRPGLIGVQYACVELDSTDVGTMQIHWLDPAKDYLCMYRESHQRKGLPWVKNPNWQPDEPLTTTRPEGSIHEHDSVQEILECAQSPDGKWYPKVVRQSGASLVEGKRCLWGPATSRLQVDFTGPVPDELFELPEEVKAFKQKK